jgi:putative membrane protein
MRNVVLPAIAVTLLSFGFTASSAHADAAKLTDPQIAHIAYTAGVLDIKAAKLALKKTKNPDVKTFAQDMVRDHTSVND